MHSPPRPPGTPGLVQQAQRLPAGADSGRSPVYLLPAVKRIVHNLTVIITLIAIIVVVVIIIIIIIIVIIITEIITIIIIIIIIIIIVIIIVVVRERSQNNVRGGLMRKWGVSEKIQAVKGGCQKNLALVKGGTSKI